MDRAALIVAERTTTYRQLAQRVERWTSALVAADLAAGERIVLLAGNDEVFVIGYLAALRAGLVVIPLNPHVPGPELERELAVLDARAAIVGVEARMLWAAVGAGREFGIEVDFVAEPSSTSSEAVTIVTLDRLAEEREGVAAATPTVEREDGDPAVLLFTSGTSGTSKPAVLTHGNLWASVRSLLDLPDVDLSDHHRALAVIPLFHVFGLSVIINLGLTIGATLVLEDHVSPQRTASLVRDHEITLLLGPPTMWAAFVADETVAGDDFASVRLAVSGAAKLDARVWSSMWDRFGVDVREGYGLTETCATVSSAAGVDCPPGSVGLPLPGVELRIVDTEGRDVLVGDTGEILVRGPMVSPGYWVDGAVTRQARTEDHWLRTGDLGIVDDNGHVSVVDRIKDLIIVSGFNVYPGEVEAVIAGHPDVAAVGVVGEPDDEHGEQVVAYVVAVPGGAQDSDALRRYASDRLARYKVPRRVEFLDELPIGAIGKLHRRELGPERS